MWSRFVSVTGPTSSSLDCLAEEPATGRGSLFEVNLAELAGKDFLGMEDAASKLGTDLTVPTPLRCRNGGINKQQRKTKRGVAI